MCALPIHPYQSHARWSFLVLSSRYAWLLSPLLFSLAADHCSTQRRVAPYITLQASDALAPILGLTTAYPSVQAVGRIPPPLPRRAERGIGADAGFSLYSSKQSKSEQDHGRQIQTNFGELVRCPQAIAGHTL